MSTYTTAYDPQWVGAINPLLPGATYWVIVTGATTTLAVVLSLVALVWLLRLSRPHHALAEEAVTASVAVLVVAVVVTTLGTASAVSLGEWWWVLIAAWSVAGVAAAGAVVTDSRRRSYSPDAAPEPAGPRS